MKLTKQSQSLISFFLKKNCIKHLKTTKKTEKILTNLYNDILEAKKYIENIKEKITKTGSSFYNLKIKKIQNVSEIPKPTTFPSDSFPKQVREYINETTNYHLSYTFHLFNRTIIIHFLVENNDIEFNIELYNHYIDIMLIWIYILNQYSSPSCSKELTIYIYFTELLKKLPESNVYVLSADHVNTAFTYTCQKVSEIVVYRKEEWFKVFMHETFHNFALDFSNMNTEQCHLFIKNIFPLNSEVNLYEAYAEFWAEMMNVCFCSFMQMNNENNVDEFLSNCEFYIYLEQNYSFFQMIKTLEFMGLKYTDLYSMNHQSMIMRENLYKEDTNVLSYYIIKLILFNNYQGFLSWCDKNNTSLLQFKKTLKNQMDFCKFIEKNYKTTTILENIECIEKVVKNIKHKSKNNNTDFLLKNMRMSICELG